MKRVKSKEAEPGSADSETFEVLLMVIEIYEMTVFGKINEKYLYNYGGLKNQVQRLG